MLLFTGINSKRKIPTTFCKALETIWRWKRIREWPSWTFWRKSTFRSFRTTFCRKWHVKCYIFKLGTVILRIATGDSKMLLFLKLFVLNWIVCRLFWLWLLVRKIISSNIGISIGETYWLNLPLKNTFVSNLITLTWLWIRKEWT